MSRTGVTGNLRNLTKLAKNTARLSSDPWRSNLNRRLAGTALALIDQGFSEGKDPYGTPWPVSIRAKAQSGQTLRDTARLNRSFTRKIHNANGFTVGTNVPYAAAHQDGAIIRIANARRRNKRGEPYRRIKINGNWRTIKKDIHLPQRRMIPDSGNLGPTWENAFQTEIQNAITELLDAD